MEFSDLESRPQRGCGGTADGLGGGSAATLSKPFRSGQRERERRSPSSTRDSHRIVHRVAAGILAAAFALAGTEAQAEAPTAASARASAPLLPWKLVATHPHAATDFTQGLVWKDGRLFESAGQYGASRLAEKKLATGATLRETRLKASEFGEGLTVHGGELWQLTWREGVAYVYDLALKPLRQFAYKGNAWGLTSNGRELVLSDGSPHLYFLDPATFSVTRKVRVRDGQTLVSQLNELEWIDGAVYANVWFSERVARIDPETGTVTGWLDLAALRQAAGVNDAAASGGAVLNGIAWRPDTKRLLVTGKYWPKLFEIELAAEPRR